MQEPSVATASDCSAESNMLADQDRRRAGPVDYLDPDLRSLTEGIAMMGRFELQLLEYESTLGEADVPGG